MPTKTPTSPLPPMNIHVTCPRSYSPYGSSPSGSHNYHPQPFGQPWSQQQAQQCYSGQTNLDPNTYGYSSRDNIQSNVNNYSRNLGQEVHNMFSTLPKKGQYRPRYDPASLQDQEREIYEEQKRQELLAVKHSPYRSQGVVSPKPKTKHDHVLGSYLYMQHYPDAPTHGSPMPPAPMHHVDPLNQARFNQYVQQADPNVIQQHGLQGVKMPYNTPLGLYSKENAVNTLRQTNPTAANQGVRLVPDSTLFDGSDISQNLANSPTWQMVQQMDSKQSSTHHQVSSQQSQQSQSQKPAYSPVNVEYLSTSSQGGRVSPQQSASFKVGVHYIPIQIM